MFIRWLLALLLMLTVQSTHGATSTLVASSPQQSPAHITQPIQPVVSPAPPLVQNTQSKWEPKDYVLVASGVITFILGVWNLIANHRFNRRTTFVNTVTSQRIKWIEQLRQDISAFSGLVYHWSNTELPDKTEERQIIKEIDRLHHVIRLRLNPAGTHDQTIEKLLSEIPQHTSDQIKIKELLEKLTCTAQALLKDEWEKVKAESKKGPLSDRA